MGEITWWEGEEDGCNRITIAWRLEEIRCILLGMPVVNLGNAVVRAGVFRPMAIGSLGDPEST